MTAITCSNSVDSYSARIEAEARLVLDIKSARREAHERTALNRRCVDRPGGRRAWVPVDLAEQVRSAAMDSAKHALAAYYCGEQSAILDIDAGDLPAGELESQATYIMCERMGYKKLGCPFQSPGAPWLKNEEPCDES